MEREIRSAKYKYSCLWNRLGIRIHPLRVMKKFPRIQLFAVRKCSHATKAHRYCSLFAISGSSSNMFIGGVCSFASACEMRCSVDQNLKDCVWPTYYSARSSGVAPLLLPPHDPYSRDHHDFRHICCRWAPLPVYSPCPMTCEHIESWSDAYIGASFVCLSINSVQSRIWARSVKLWWCTRKPFSCSPLCGAWAAR